jgi:DMSO/TMAO reductase YedYZ molybdopterin-dependent catalytic subunit
MSVRRFFSVFALLVVLATAFVAGRASADQPHMQAALEHLRAAKVELDAATADKGGHRAKAIAFTKDAIAEVERGIVYDRRH